MTFKTVKFLKKPYSYILLAIFTLFSFIVNFKTTWAAILLGISFVGFLFLMYLDRGDFKKSK
ncbi:hypothetical protein [Lysinibacillus pakistanensis]|uniref:hypothetical protein n=1 Tax=Lysinibacillus pakistanensis TaxID=759811 RepID=UPI0034E48BE4